MRGRLFIVWVFFLLAGFAIPSKASHIVGGEMTYVYLGYNDVTNTYSYKVTLTIYEDCLNGQPDAIAEDNPGIIYIYDLKTGLPVIKDSELYAPVVPVPTNFNNSCINNAPATCLEKRTFSQTYNLPPSGDQFIAVYQRCCRNATVLNILDPSEVGATYYCIIPPTDSIHNNSAVFNNFPPQIICINNPLVYDNSATDPDGDSLSYEFCSTYTGGTGNNAKPDPPPPPYINVTYNNPFSYQNPMGGFPQIQIDPVTGLITGTPNLLGRFVVTVCCNEWRNGEIINTLKREFQFVVTNCSKAVVANMPQYSSEPNTYIVNCKNYTVHFVNTSQGGFSYYWDFGVPGATSTDFEPTYTYPDTGTYKVSLIVNKGSTCTDSISRFVKVYPTFQAAYMYTGTQCPGLPISFKDISTSTFKPISGWVWNFGDGTTAAVEDTIHSYAKGGIYNVTLAATNSRGCEDTMYKQVVIEQFKPFAGDDTIIVANETLNFNATGGQQYTWTPATNLSNAYIYNPSAFYPDTGHYAYNVHIVSSFGCEGNDSIKVWVVNQASLFVPTAFTPNGDGKNDILKPIAIGYSGLRFFRVFDRWGQMIYNSHTLETGWDGTFNGRPMPIGTYYWELSTTNRFGREEKAKGDVTLIR